MVSKEPATSALQLSDFDWKLLHTVASDKIASIKQPLLRLQLYTQPEHPTVPGTQGNTRIRPHSHTQTPPWGSQGQEGIKLSWGVQCVPGKRRGGCGATR